MEKNRWRRRLKRVVTSGLDEAFTIPLVNVLETFFPLSTTERRRFRRLVSREEYREVRDTELTWADRLREEGREKGREEAKRETLKRLLSSKFGPLPAAVTSRIDAIDSAEALDRHLDRILAASSLDELGLEG